MSLFEKISAKAKPRRHRIGIGLVKVDSEIKAGLERSLEYADVVVIGSQVEGFKCVTVGDPNKK